MGTVFDLPAISQRNGGQFRDSGPEDSSALQFPHKLAAGWELPAAQTRGGQALPPLKYAAAAHLESFRALCSRASGPALSCTQDLNFSCCDPFSEYDPQDSCFSPVYDQRVAWKMPEMLLYPRVCRSIRVRTQGQALLVLRRQVSPSMRPAPAPLLLMPLAIHEITRCGT